MPQQNSPKFRFPQVRIVEASAGSGKTYALAKRYVQLLINPTLSPNEIPLRNILAITFSNKATMEMKARILDFLKRIALDKFSDQKEKKELVASLEVDFAAAQKKALAIMEDIVFNYNFFQVQTIDSFVNAVLSGCAFKLGLSANFRIKADAKEHLTYSLDKLIDAAATDKKVRDAFHDFISQYLYLENKTGWFPKDDILAISSDLFYKLNRLGGSFLPGNADAEKLILKKKKLLSKMRRLRKNWPKGAHKAFEKNFTEFLEENKNNFDFGSVSDYFKREEFPVVKGEECESATRRFWSEIVKELSVLAGLESRVVLNPYVDIFSKVLGYFKALSKKADCLFLDELNREAGVLFDEKEVTVPELYYRLATRLRHFLIDEFQDTSSLQWQNLAGMIEEALATGGSLFYVGDKKQAIYRFRGGEAGLFDSVKERFKDHNLILESLNQNHRSLSEIVSFTNEVFSQGNLKKLFLDFSASEEEAVLNVFEGCQQSFIKGREGGYVKVEYVDPEDSKERLLSLVCELLKRFNPVDIAVLARENDDVELLTEWLVEKGLAVESEKTLNIRNNAAIKEIVSFLKFLDSPIDDLSFASFIMGDIFLNASGLKKDDVDDFIFGFREKNRQEKPVYLYREFRRKYPKAWDEFFEEFFRSVGFIPLYELTVSIFRRFDCFNSFPGQQGFLMRLLELIKEKEEEKNGLALFLEFFQEATGEELYVRASKTDAVKVLTIHKAKGLGFPVVILPFLDMKPKVGPIISRFQDARLTLTRMHKKYRNFCKDVEAIYREEYLKSFIDELNVLYVALTRPREELYIFLPQGAKKPSLCSRLFSFSDRVEWGRITERQREAAKKKEPLDLELSPSSCEDWVKFLKDEFIEGRLLENRKNILRGEAFHYILSCLGDLSSQDQGLALEDAINKARHKFPHFALQKDDEDVLRRFLEDERFRPFFFAGDKKIFQEQEIIDGRGNTRRVDRLIVGRQEAYVIDYKTSKEKHEQDVEQMQEYASLVRGIFPDKEVKGFLIYLDTLELQAIL
ncbi:MAG: UvrD-helicase domain-containing protein [Candidatus Omnitrophota bacterium]